MPNFYCNRCSRQLTVTSVPQSATSHGSVGSSEAAAKAYVTTCKHMFCQNCIEKCKEACVRCNQPCRATVIDERLPAHLRSCFEPIPQQIGQFQRQVDAARTIQLDQNRIRAQQLMQINQRYKEANAKAKAEKAEATQRFEEAMTLNRKLKLLKQIIQVQRNQKQVFSVFCTHQFISIYSFDGSNMKN